MKIKKLVLIAGIALTQKIHVQNLFLAKYSVEKRIVHEAIYFYRVALCVLYRMRCDERIV